MMSMNKDFLGANPLPSYIMLMASNYMLPTQVKCSPASIA